MTKTLSTFLIAACVIVAMLCPVIWYKVVTYPAEPPMIALRNSDSMRMPNYQFDSFSPCEG